MSTEHNLKPGTVLVAGGDEEYTVSEPIAGEILHTQAPAGTILVTFESGGHEYADYLYPEEIESVVSTPAPEPTGFNVELAYLAAKYGRTLVFQYAKGSGGVIEQRRLQPESITTAKNGAVVLIGNDPDRDDVRAYRVDRIKGDASIA